MINPEMTLDCYREENYIAASFPYGNKAYSMIVILPDKGTTVNECIKDLDRESLASLANGEMYSEGLDVKLPKFTLDYYVSLEDILRSLGVTEAFDLHSADFSAMWNRGNMFLGLAAQSNTIIVDEDGTEASSATIGGSGDLMPGPMLTKEFYVDRPFAFIIAERSTGLPLFMGRVTKL